MACHVSEGPIHGWRRGSRGDIPRSSALATLSAHLSTSQSFLGLVSLPSSSWARLEAGAMTVVTGVKRGLAPLGLGTDADACYPGAGTGCWRVGGGAVLAATIRPTGKVLALRDPGQVQC
jgi:hypothetical protein